MPYAYDPELAPAVPLLPEIDISDPTVARKEAASLFDAVLQDLDLTGLTVGDHFAPQPDGATVRVRVYRPASSANPLPGLLYIHGGGFISGSIDSEHAAAAALADELRIVVASVDYRLAPEHPYPAALDDCSAALIWLHANSHELGVDPGRVGVYGQSAGGGLAAALTLFTRDRGGPPIRFQFLGMPELDDRLDTPSMRAFIDTPLWNRGNAILSWRHYLGGLDGDVPIYAAPARADDLSGLPPAYVSAMEFDPLRDEAIDYATRMLHAGVHVELHIFPGTFHGSGLIAHAAVSRRAKEEAENALRKGLSVSGEPLTADGP
jgi:acetyl esterase/lipase